MLSDGGHRTEDIISSYEPFADLFFLYFNIGPNNNKTKIKKNKKIKNK